MLVREVAGSLHQRGAVVAQRRSGGGQRAPSTGIVSTGTLGDVKRSASWRARRSTATPSSGRPRCTSASASKQAATTRSGGGTAGEQFDPCYHLACDTLANVDLHALEVNADAIAYAVFTYAASTEAVNGVAGARLPTNFPVPPPAGPAGTFVGESGGDEHDHDAAVE